MDSILTSSPRIGNGYDVHALKEGLPMRLCGVDVPSDKGFVAHSDGDVAIHALCDALLGAAALGDIGLHFPDSDPRYKGIDSTKLLSEVVAMLSREGNPEGSRRYQIVNVDITIALQEPKLRPFIDTMRETLAGIMNIDIDQVSVKATTTERLGFVGRGEGCEVWASALIIPDNEYKY
ncbi:MAG: 2-C-methyl-D-erythritol 2,4-cyclodiphosphate synthase [Bacteroidales bacterium]|nr:2-C-methyl-D-erythritol 2,4-cyclodiphosphate synthase [Bacteroidales bacterium]